MKKRFVVLLDTCTEQEEEAIRLRFAGRGWWHWLPNVWLLTDLTGTFTAVAVRDELRQLLPTKHTLVLELSGAQDTWAGLGPQTQKQNMFKWIKEQWK